MFGEQLIDNTDLLPPPTKSPKGLALKPWMLFYHRRWVSKKILSVLTLYIEFTIQGFKVE